MSKIKSIIIIIVILVTCLVMAGCDHIVTEHSKTYIDDVLVEYDGIRVSDEARDYINECNETGKEISIDVVQYLSENES